MKSIFVKLGLFFVFFFVGYANYAQDKIIKKDGEVLEVIIKEINDKQVKYVDYKDPDGILFTLDRALIKEIIFAHGKKMEVKNPEENPWYFADDKINNLMLNFSGIGGNTLGLSYERVLKPGQSVLGELKIYGWGIDSYEQKSKSGVGFDLYYRLKIKSFFSNKEYRPKHILHGGYFAPNIGFSTGKDSYYSYYYFWEDGNYYEKNTYYDVKHTIMNIGISYGKQWILQNTLSIDASIGFHYYFGDVTSDFKKYDNYFFDDDDFLRLGNMWGTSNKLWSFSLRIGFLTGKDRIVKKED